VILEEAEKLYSKVVKDCINKIIIIDYPLSKPLSLPLLPHHLMKNNKVIAPQDQQKLIRFDT